MGKKPIKKYKNLIIFMFIINLSLASASEYLCNQTYQKNLEDVEMIKNQTILDNQSEQRETIEYYINNWQRECSELINKTLEPKYVCEKIYFFIIDKNYMFNQGDLEILKNKISEKIEISNNLLIYYIKEYKNLCSRLEYSDVLPELEESNLIIYLDKIDCSVDNDNTIFNMKIKVMNYNLGDINCNKINQWKGLVYFEKDKGDYYLVGLRVWVVVLLFFLVISVYLINLNSKMNKSIKNLK